MKRNLIKTLSILLIVVAILFAFTSPAFAATTDEGYKADFVYNNTAGDASNMITSIIASIIFIAQVIGVGVATIMLIVLAIKYIAASPNDKAEIKKHIVVYVVGALILFGASGLLQVIKSFALNNINNKVATTDTQDTPATPTNP